MARPAIDHMLDHTVRVWRPVVSKDDYGAESSDYQLVASLNAAVNRSSAPVADIGPGFAPTGTRRVYLRPDAQVQPRDVVELVTGPDAPGTWEVDEPPTHPRGHHTQVDCIAWHGVLPTVVES